MMVDAKATRRMAGAWALLVVLVAGAMGAGCSVQCGACPTALTVRVKSSSGEPVKQATVTSASGEKCKLIEGEVFCQMGSRAGDYELTVTALDHEPQTRKVSVPRDDDDGECNCGFIQQSVEVTLEPSKK